MSSITRQWLADLKDQAQRLKAEIHSLVLVYRDPRTPLLPKIIITLVVAYALSPIDLIPDFIPVLGYLDDLVLLPLGIAVAIWLIDPELMAECRQQAAQSVQERRPSNWVAGGVIITLWLFTAALAILWFLR